ncbi:hypothetical protein C8A01DRAFT_50223 [Parachaetomium inaequale]|uniref:DUF202 domain-containing protein n=1 Tax=Parachaetomium inaequale TaxID=2588326 RepID=A0AAN6P7D8_9PEZI|nr:hypothetical protein C8A01DRAFT_50223 [Parachaetomium inaequale]
MSTKAGEPALSRSATLQLTRRQSSKDRIRDILEGARERAESLDPNSANVSPRLQPLLDRSRRASDPCGSAPPPELGGSSNGHGIVTAQPERQRGLNYHSTVETSPAARRRSALRRKSSGQQPGQPSPQTVRPGEEDGRRERPRQQEESGWKRTLQYFKSIELENKGSVARDHLALERTFLAWLRTSLAFASIGIAITQLFRLNTSLAEDTKQAETLRQLGKPLGTTFLAVSILILLLGYNRYLQGQYWVIKGKFPASRGTIMVVALIAFSVTLASLVVILAVQNNPL